MDPIKKARELINNWTTQVTKPRPIVGGLVGKTVSNLQQPRPFVGGAVGQVVRQAAPVIQRTVTQTINAPRPTTIGKQLNLSKPVAPQLIQGYIQNPIRQSAIRYLESPRAPQVFKTLANPKLSTSQQIEDAALSFGPGAIAGITKNIGKQVVKTALPKQLQPLAKEAGKYKSAEEFADYYVKNQNKIKNPPEYQKYLQEKDTFVKREMAIYERMKDLRGKYKGITRPTPNQLKQEKIDRAEYVRLDEELKKVLSKKTLAPIPEGTIKTIDHIGESGFRNQLTDIYTQATGGVKPKISAKQLTKPIVEMPVLDPKALPGQVKALTGQRGGSSGSSGKSISQVGNPTDPYFNVKRLNVSDQSKAQVKQVIEEAKPSVERFVGARLTNKETINLANNSAKVLHRTVTRKETLDWQAKLLKARQLLAAQATDGRVTQEYIDNLMAVKSQGTDIARKLQSMSIGADPQTVTAKQAILEAILKVSDDTDNILKAAQGVDFNDYRQATEFYRQFVKPTKEDWIDLIRYNSMLSSPNTHIINTASNFQGTGIIAPIEKTILGGVDFLGSKLTGKPRQYAVGEGAAYARGYYSNLKNAAVKFADVMKGKVMIENPDLRTIPLATKGKAKIAENVLAVYPMRLLEGMDQFFVTLTKGGVERSLDYRASKGIKVFDPTTKAKNEAVQRLFRGDFTPEGQGHVLGVLDSGANAVMALRNSENPIVRTIAKFTLPFVKTPTNILKQGIEYSPLGVSTLWGATNKTEQLTKALMGSAIGAGVATLVGSDRMTWAEPTDAKQKAAFRAAGFQPYSVKVGDNWVSYSKLHPAIAFNLALVAAVYDAEKNQKLGEGEVETVLEGLSKWVNFFADQSYVKNIGDFVASTKGDLEGPARQLSNYPQQLIPFRALMGWVNRIIDPVQRKSDSTGSLLDRQLQQLMMQFPGFSQNVPARLDTRGQPIPNQNRLLNAFSPARVTTERPAQKRDYDYFTNAKRSFANLKQLPKDEANAIGKQIKKDNPALFGQIKSMAKDDKLGTTPEEAKIRELGVGDNARASRVIQELNKLPNREAKNAKVKEWKAKGIITDEVWKQLKELKKAGKLSASNLSQNAPATKQGLAPVVQQLASKATSLISRPQASNNINLVTKALQDEGVLSPQVLAYTLATIEHETAGTFEPIEEYGGRQQAIRLGYGGGENYYGRGFIQLTHRENYETIGRRIGVPELADRPELALDPEISAKILAAFIKDRGVAALADRGDFVGARRPVNGTDKAQEIAQAANRYLSGLSS